MPDRGGVLGARRFFGEESRSAEGWSALVRDGREWESFYRDRWQHDRVVRSTHGVNCTGSCSWKIHVKDGIVAWETQQTDYPSNGPDVPEYEPRGCPRGASFSWYVYSPLRVRYPYVRGVLLDLYREALARTGDPVAAWADVVDDPVKAHSYKSQRGKGGFVRASWDEVAELVAAAHVQIDFDARAVGEHLAAVGERCAHLQVMRMIAVEVVEWRSQRVRASDAEDDRRNFVDMCYDARRID